MACHRWSLALLVMLVLPGLCIGCAAEVDPPDPAAYGPLDPEVKALVGLWSYNGPAILNAVREAGKVGKVRIVTFDEADETLAGIKAGAIHATVVQQPYEFGYQAITRMAQAVRGDRSFIPETKQIIVPTMVVNRNNVDEFTQRINTLRGR